MMKEQQQQRQQKQQQQSLLSLSNSPILLLVVVIFIFMMQTSCITGFSMIKNDIMKAKLLRSSSLSSSTFRTLTSQSRLSLLSQSSSSVNEETTTTTSETTTETPTNNDATTPNTPTNDMMPNMSSNSKLKSMDDIISLCKRRGIIYQSSEIYNGYAGFYDYGPIGIEIKNNIKQSWWKYFVHERDDIVGLDSSIIHHPTTWKVSGHVDGFSDPMVDCKETKLRYRADQLYYSPIQIEGDDDNTILGYICVQEGNDDEMLKSATKQAKETLKSLEQYKDIPSKNIKLQSFQFHEVANIDNEEFMKLIPNPITNKIGTLTLPRSFNLMFTTNVGANVDTSSIAYLRPETAQGIFLNYKNVLDTNRIKIPFGIAQIGKAFRNEITPRNFIFRSREFEQMEIEYFIEANKDYNIYHQQWIELSKDYLLSIVGLNPDMISYDIHIDDKLAHYAKACTDITFTFPFGKQELMGIAARGNYDLTQHSNGSGKSLDYYDEQTKERYIPHCIEPSLGVDRLVLALICSVYDEDEIGGEKRTLLRFNPKMAPIKVAVLPLVKNKEELVNIANELYQKCKKRWNCSFDTTGAIGRRYRRADEVGTPFCITIDFDTIEKGDEQTVTIRDRDTTNQIRIPMKDVIPYLSNAIDGY